MLLPVIIIAHRRGMQNLSAYTYQDQDAVKPCNLVLPRREEDNNGTRGGQMAITTFHTNAVSSQHSPNPSATPRLMAFSVRLAHAVTLVR